MLFTVAKVGTTSRVTSTESVGVWEELGVGSSEDCADDGSGVHF